MSEVFYNTTTPAPPCQGGEQGEGEGSYDSVMIPNHCYKNRIFSGPVDKSVFVVDAARPVAGEAVFEGFRLSGSGERVAHDLMDKPVDAFEHLFVGLLPVEVVFPGMLREDEFHSASLRTLPPPRSSSAMDSMSRLAFFGTRSRYAVSSSALKSSRESITTDSSFCRVMITGSWSSQTFFMVVARLVLAAEYVIVSIMASVLLCTSYCTVVCSRSQGRLPAGEFQGGGYA